MSYRAIDTLIGTFSGAIIAFAVHQATPEGLNMLSGMLLGMLVGMALHFILMLSLLPFFGSFEVMVPLHIIGMLVGMTSGMIATMPGVAMYCNTATGGAIGGAVAMIVQYSDKKLRGWPCR